MNINFDREFLDTTKEPSFHDLEKSFQFLNLLNRIANKTSTTPYEITRGDKSYAPIYIRYRKTGVETKVPLSAVVAAGMTYGLNRESLSQHYSIGTWEEAAPTNAEAILRTFFFIGGAEYCDTGKDAWNFLSKKIYFSKQYSVEDVVVKMVDEVHNTLAKYAGRKVPISEKEQQIVMLHMGDSISNMEYEIRIGNLSL
ncbi:MAG: hypothetical protein MAG795_00186 [Candidatus Woesearchaeota archaeon]|nr:hypothetical protein [Candidatus Woesearchaeota archaeon]